MQGTLLKQLCLHLFFFFSFFSAWLCMAWLFHFHPLPCFPPSPPQSLLPTDNKVKLNFIWLEFDYCFFSIYVALMVVCFCFSFIYKRHLFKIWWVEIDKWSQIPSLRTRGQASVAAIQTLVFTFVRTVLFTRFICISFPSGVIFLSWYIEKT